MLDDYRFLLFLWWKYIAAFSEDCGRDHSGMRLAVEGV